MEEWIIICVCGAISSFLGRLYGYFRKESPGYITELGVIWGIVGLATGVGIAGIVKYY